MAEDVVIVNGDQIQITINPPTIVPQLAAPVPLVASGFTTVNDNAVCVEGDELPPSIKSPLQYTSPPFVTPGMGTVSVTLQAANKTSATTDKDKKILLKGQTFQATFSVTVPAQQPSPGGPVPDPTPKYSGTAQFISTDTLTKAD
jgi:Contractile injection system spike tip protein